MYGRYNDYIEGFLNQNKTEDKLYLTLFKNLEDIKKFITYWDNYDLDIFMKNIGSVSVNTITKYFQYIKNIYNYICIEENIIPKNLNLIHTPRYYIDNNKLKDVIIDEYQYNFIKNILTVQVQGVEYNYRDKVIVQLAWHGLSVDEIRNLKKDDIRLEGDTVTVKLEDRNIVVNDKEFTKDMRKTIEQNVYYVYHKNGRGRFMDLKDTEYLIRAVSTNQRSMKSSVGNPSQMIAKTFKDEDLGDVIEGVDMTKLTLEAIKRSRAIDMFKKGVNVEEVAEFLGKKTLGDLYWIEEIGLRLKKEEIL